MSENLYIDNVNVNRIDTSIIKGNVISDNYGGSVTGIKVSAAQNLRVRENRVVRMRSMVSSVGYDINSAEQLMLSYNVASRCNVGIILTETASVSAYNVTVHNCDTAIQTNSKGIFKNISLSAYQDWKNYRNCTGFDVDAATTISVDYLYYYGISDLDAGAGSVTYGSSVYNEQIIYKDEPNDDLTPDHISLLVGTGTTEPKGETSPSIGGIQSQITDEPAANRKYQYELLDNSFWDIENDYSGEMSLIKALQSRVLANSELSEKQTEEDFYIKTANSLTYFSEAFPVYSRYQTSTKYKKRVMDLWYSTQNVGTATSYNRAIGGYNLLPSFFRRMVDYYDCWIIGHSAVNYDNYLTGVWAQKYGLGIDVLGVSTLTEESSGECYNNTMNCIADIAPIHWNLHNEVQPPGYIVFSPFYNSFEYCELTNMIYNDDYHISINETQVQGQILTPYISTDNLAVSGILSPSGELSTLDRVNSEIIERTMFYRFGNDSTDMSSWQEIKRPIGEVIYVGDKQYLQFKIITDYVLDAIDYEFLGLAVRRYVPTDVTPLTGGSLIQSVTLLGT